MTKPIDEAVIRAQLNQTLGDTSFPELGEKYEGKVRDCYVRDGRRTLIATDRISAFDVVLGTIPFKGQVLNQKLPTAILTPSTKAEKGQHDRSVSRAEILELGALSAADFDAAAGMCARVFAFGQQEALRRGLILVDTKYELGRRSDGTLCFIDEVHTPDSSRYWYANDYEDRFTRGEEPRGLDKEYVRRTLADQGYRGDGPPPPLADDVRVEAARRYIQVCELVTGRPFVPDTEEPNARIRRNLKL